MSVDNRSTNAPRSEPDNAEARMRLALGLRDSSSPEHPPQQRADQARPKHRFAKDGEIPVVVLHGRREQEIGASPRNRVVSLETSLHAERTARLVAERALAEANAHLQSLRTKLAHAELANREARDAAVAVREELEHALAAAQADRSHALDEVAALQAAAQQVIAQQVIAQQAAVQQATMPEALIVAPKRPTVSRIAAAKADPANPDLAKPDPAKPNRAKPDRAKPEKIARAAAAPRTRQAKPVKWWVPGYRAAKAT